jgi:cysteine desulfurase
MFFKRKEVYMDNAATTKVDEKVVKTMQEILEKEYGNPSSVHTKGLSAKRELELAREVIAKKIGAKDSEIVFTGSGTEANNFALKGLFWKYKDKGKNHIIVSKIEHDCVLRSCKWLESQGAEVTYLDVDKEGFVNPLDLEKAIKSNTLVVSIIQGNNEIGTINDISVLGKICKKNNVFFHTDACQSFTKVPINVDKMNIDLMTLNAHKIHGPKGVGALYIRKGIEITPLLHGGGQERKLRSSTENVSGIIGFAKAVERASSSDIKNMVKLRDLLINELEKIPSARLNGARGEKRLCNNISFSFRGIEGEAIGGYLDAKGICSSNGSACSSKSLEASHVIKAINSDELYLNGTIRLSLSKYTTLEEINYVIDSLKEIVEKLNKLSPFSRSIN